MTDPAKVLFRNASYDGQLVRTLAAEMKEPALEGQQGRLARIARAFRKYDQRFAPAQRLRHGVDGRR